MTLFWRQNPNKFSAIFKAKIYKQLVFNFFKNKGQFFMTNRFSKKIAKNHTILDPIWPIFWAEIALFLGSSSITWV